MIPKIIHLCWFGDSTYPVEVKVCLDTWKRILPDYEIRLWDYATAQSIGSNYINEALSVKKWAFAADAVRFYAVYKEGGIYMDSDIFLYKRFDELIPKHGFATFNECTKTGQKEFGLQAAFFMGEKGNSFCKELFDDYNSRHFIKEDGSFDQTISPYIMSRIAKPKGFVCEDREQHLGEDIIIYPTYHLSPSRHYNHHTEAFGVHYIYGNWRKRKLGRKLERSIKHIFNVIKYTLFKK